MTESKENIALGIMWMLGTMCLFISMDTIAKFLTQTIPAPQVVWARFNFHILCMLILLRGSLFTLIRTENLKLQLLRSTFLLLATTMFFTGLRVTPLATAATIMFLSPIVVTMLAIPLLGEQVGIRRWMGILIGFTGALIVVRPDTGSIATGHLLVIGAAISNAMYQIITRKVRARDHAMTSLLYSALVGALFTSATVSSQWQTPDALAWLLFLTMGFLGAASHFCLIRAFSLAPASTVAPYTYSALLWATLFGYIIFNDLPDRWTLIGATLIVTSGLYIFYREQQIRITTDGT